MKNSFKKSAVGVSQQIVKEISHKKNEPAWMLELRLNALKVFNSKPMPRFGPDLRALDLKKIAYFVSPKTGPSHKWEDVPADIKKTFEDLGIPQAERKYLAGAGAQLESSNIYHKLKEKWAAQGVIFEDMDAALRLYPDLVRKYFMKCVSIHDHKFAALHAAVWSGGTFAYIPENVKIDQPLQAYFRMNTASAGQFEHTLIIAEKNSQSGYIEGCSAPKYNTPSLHAGCVEIFVEEGARLRYSSVENWSTNTYNLNTKRAIVGKNATMEWIGGNFGAGVTMLYPCSILKGTGARADHLGIAFANAGQIQDIGAKVIHVGANTTSKIVSKSLSKNGGSSIYRGLVQILKGAKGAAAHMRCDALILDDKSKAHTIPAMEISENDVSANHEATVGKINEDQLFYSMSRGMSQDAATGMIVNGFIEPIAKAMPLEYAVEMNRLIELEMKDSH